MSVHGERLEEEGADRETPNAAVLQCAREVSWG